MTKIVIGGKVKTIKLKKAPVRELFDLFFKLVLAQFLIDK